MDWVNFELNYNGWVKNKPLIHLWSLKIVLKNSIHPWLNKKPFSPSINYFFMDRDSQPIHLKYIIFYFRKNVLPFCVQILEKKKQNENSGIFVIISEKKRIKKTFPQTQGTISFWTRMVTSWNGSIIH